MEWLCCLSPWVTPKHVKPPQFLHFALPCASCLMHLHNWWSQRIQIWCTGWMLQVTAYGRQTVPERGVVKSCDPLTNFWGCNHITGTLSDFVRRSGISILARRWHITHKRGVVMVTWRDCFEILPWCRASHGFVSDRWATCLVNCQVVCSHWRDFTDLHDA